MIRRIHLIAVLPTALACAGVALAAVSPGTFIGNLHEFSDELDAVLIEQQAMQAERAYETSQEFFPPIAQQQDAVIAVDQHADVADFTDVPATAWFARYAKDMAAQRIMEGYLDAQGLSLGLFGPADPVTIEQIAKMAVISARVDQTKCPSAPKNAAASGRWSASFIACAEQLGWQVFADGAVEPARPALRSEVVTTVLEAFGRELEPATGTVFQDVSATMPARHAIETAARDGIVSGYTNDQGNPTGLFGPFDNVNRAETAKIFSLALDTYGL